MRIKIILLAIAILSLISTVFANQDNKIHIAIISDQSSGTNISSIVSLLEVELSKRQELNLLERAQINKILEEQKLSISGLSDPETALKLGNLLHVDMFVFQHFLLILLFHYLFHHLMILYEFYYLY